MKTIFKNSCFFFFLFFAFYASGQQYNFKKYTTKNGLANSTVQQIFQDQQGFVWLATSGGLSRFDGRKFKNYYTTNGLSSNDLICLLEDKNQNLWIGTINGLCKFDGISITHYANLGFDNSIYSIYQDRNNNIWFTTFGSGLVCYDGKKFKKYTQKEGLPTDSLFSIIQDSKGDYWVGTYHYGVFKIKENSFKNEKLEYESYTKKNGLSSNNIYSILEIAPGKIWLGSTNGGLNQITEKTAHHIYISEETEGALITSMHKDERGTIWIGSFEHGLIKYFENAFTFYNEKNGMISHSINYVYEDNEKNFWIGTDQGVNLFKNEAFMNMKEENGLPLKFVQCFAQLPNGNILCGTAKGISEWDGKKLRIITDIPELRDASIQSIANDDLGNYWIGTQSGLIICSYQKKFKLIKTVSEYEGNYTYPVSCIINDGHGKMYVSTFGNGLFSFENDKIVHYGLKEGLKSESIYSLFIDTKQNLWLATWQGGAIKFDTKKFAIYSKKDGLADSTVYGIAEDRRGNLLFATSQGGLSSYDGKKFHNFDESTGLISNLILTVKVDKSNTIWLGTNNGLNKVVITDYFVIDKSKVYNDLNGLEGNEFGISSLFIDKDGIIWAGTNEGLTRFDPKLDFANETPPKLILQEIRLAYQKVDWKNYSEQVNNKTGLPVNLELSYKDNHLTFLFQALTTDNNVKYRYMLEGLEKNWSPSTTNTEAIYANIPSGRDYVFKVQAVNSDGVWSNTNIEYPFTIQSPFWQRWWFILLSIVALISLLILFINYRTKKLAQEKKILEDKVEERTLELKDTNSKLNVAFTDIKDSINYAQRIQQAILPVEQKIKDVLPDSFILFKPRDIVSGDFYWFGMVEKNKETYYIIAAADCTGHGVPGAFMSMIGNTILNEIVVTKEIIEPSEILSQLHNGVRKALKQNENESRDGMDISLCCLNLKSKEVIFAGAFNPLWILRNNKSVEIIKATKSAIGGFTSDRQIFESHKVVLEKGESIYLFTDGYADQFGGENGKKLTTKKFRDTIVSLHEKPMKEQGFFLDNFIEIWRGSEFQVDDILVIGVRL
jgi:ligand-binding sensor domain-containing protein/serine phosphatase RsbU (regulator of sigma subunit)